MTPTLENAYDAISEITRRRLFVNAARHSPHIKSQLFDMALLASRQLYGRDWKSEAIEASNWTVDMYGDDEYRQSEAASDEILQNIARSLRSAAPFLPDQFIAESAITVLEVLAEDEDAKESHINTLLAIALKGLLGLEGLPKRNLRSRLDKLNLKAEQETEDDEEETEDGEEDEDYEEDIAESANEDTEEYTEDEGDSPT